MDVKFFASLFEGDNGNGVKLGMGLTGGDFWPRVDGCRNLYRGEEPYDIDFDELIAVTDLDVGTVFANLHHHAATAYVYAMREANGCGAEQQGPGAVVRAAFDAEGELIGPRCNDTLNLDVRQVAGCRARVVWYYCPLDEVAGCVEFRIYTDGGSGKIDFENVAVTVECTGSRLYGYTSGLLSEGRHLFCVRCVTGAGLEKGGGSAAVVITAVVPVSVTGLTVEAV